MQLPGWQVRAVNLRCQAGFMLPRASVLASPKGTLCRSACDVISDKWRQGAICEKLACFCHFGP